MLKVWLKKAQQQQQAFQFVLLTFMFTDVGCDHVLIVFCLSVIFPRVTL